MFDEVQMDCHKIIDRICEDLSEDIDSELCRTLRSHLQECADCRAQVESMRLIVNLYRCLQQKDVPTAVHNRLLTLLNIPEI